jgi:uncharacterized cupredoxin-like copper-binding protein
VEDGDGWSMLVSADEWAGPIQAEVGPDGALWIADWYNFIIQHNPTPSVASAGVDAVNGKGNAYIDPLRDHERGRIYRLAYKKNDQKNKLSLDKNNTSGLVKALSHDNMFWRTTAQRLLVEKKDAAALAGIYKVIQNQQLDAIGINAPAVHGLWTLHGMGVLDGSNAEALDVAVKALRHPAAGVRKAAIEVLPKTAASFEAMVAANVFKDADLRVRLAATLALIDTPSLDAMGELLVDMADQEENIADTWLRHALIIASNINSDSFQAAFRSRGLEDNPALMNATLAQRLAYGPRLNTLNLRRTFGRNPGTEAPEVLEKEILVSGEVDRAGRGGSGPFSGMVVAQGNRTNGYGVYVLDDKLYFHINQQGKVYQVVSPEAVPGTFTFKAALQRDGSMRLIVNDKEVAQGKAPGVFKKELDVPLRVGADMRKGMERIIHHPDSMFFLRAGLNNAKLEILGDILVKTEQGTIKVDQVIKLTTVKDIMKFNKELVTAKAGSTIQIVLDNIDYMQHNLVLIQPGSLEKVGAAADQLAHDPNGAVMAYVPKMPEVLKATALINPGDTYTLTVTLPNTPGDYPYVCTFPGHWRMMHGILRVTP